jgi:hypothetical protein
MWRPRQASTYFDSDATAAAIAIPVRPSRSNVGRRTKSRMCAVMSDDSRRQGSFSRRCAAASTPTHTAASTTSVAMSSTGSGPTRSKNESASATTASAARAT